MKYTYNDVTVILAELSAYRKSALLVRIDLEKQILQWKDYYQWNNNFVRSLSPDNVRLVREKLPLTRLFQWEPGKKNDEVELSDISRDTIWQITVMFSDGNSAKYAGEKIFPEQWAEFRNMIEEIARIPFKVRGWR